MRAFEPFFTTKGSKGHGLGLKDARLTIARNGGFLAIGPNEGVGTIVTVTLPLYSGDSHNAADPLR